MKLFRSWTRLAVVALLALVLSPFAVIASTPKQAAAHPLGNFTVNRYSRIDLNSSGVALRYVVDFAEVPAFQEIRAFDRDDDGLFSGPEGAAYIAAKAPELSGKLNLSINDASSMLTMIGSSVSLPDGQGGLKTLRVVLDYTAPLPAGWEQGVSAEYRDANFQGKVGWQELIIRPGDGVNLTNSTAPTMDISAELTAYPETQLKSPPEMSQASFSFEPGTGVSTAPAPAAATTERQGPKYLDGFARLIERQELTPAFVALSLLAAMAWGAAHALGPGHGKTVVAAYLVGSRGTARHALLLGLTVTFAHVSSVVTLGLVTMYASNYLSTQDLYLWLSVASGGLVFLMGCGLLYNRFRTFRAGKTFSFGQAHDHDDATVSHAHSHGGATHSHSNERLPHVLYAPGREPKVTHSHGGHGHSHEVTAPGIKGLILLGISGGILPCPTALVVMLGAIALERVTYGLVLITAFSLGLAIVLTAIGIALVYAGRMLEGSGRLARLAAKPFSSRWIQAMPMGSAAVILVVGLYLTSNALSAL